MDALHEIDECLNGSFRGGVDGALLAAGKPDHHGDHREGSALGGSHWPAVVGPIATRTPVMVGARTQVSEGKASIGRISGSMRKRSLILSLS